MYSTGLQFSKSQSTWDRPVERFDMSFDGHDEVEDILEDEDFDAVILVTVSKDDRVNYYARLREPVRTMVGPKVVDMIEKTLMPGIDVINKYPI